MAGVIERMWTDVLDSLPIERPTVAAEREVALERSPVNVQGPREMVGDSRSGHTECEVDRLARVAVPIAPFTWPQRWSRVLDRAGDCILVMPGQSEAHRNLRIDARKIGVAIGGHAGDIGQVQPVRLGDRLGHRPAEWLWFTFSMKQHSVAGDRTLQLGIRDLEAVL